MKKLFFISILLVSLFSVTSCFDIEDYGIDYIPENLAAVYNDTFSFVAEWKGSAPKTTFCRYKSSNLNGKEIIVKEVRTTKSFFEEEFTLYSNYESVYFEEEETAAYKKILSEGDEDSRLFESCKIFLNNEDRLYPVAPEEDYSYMPPFARYKRHIRNYPTNHEAIFVVPVSVSCTQNEIIRKVKAFTVRLDNEEYYISGKIYCVSEDDYKNLNLTSTDNLTQNNFTSKVKFTVLFDATEKFDITCN